MKEFHPHKTKDVHVRIVQVVVVVGFWLATFLAMFIPTYMAAKYIISIFN